MDDEKVDLETAEEAVEEAFVAGAEAGYVAGVEDTLEALGKAGQVQYRPPGTA